jgi:hypothetical protein
MKFHGFRVVLLSLALAGCGELFGRTIPQPSETITNVLYRMPGSADLMKLPERFPNTRMRVALSGSNIVWTYALAGQDACRFTAHVKASGEAMTTVWTDVEDLTERGEGYLCSTVGVAGEESVAAALDGRPADNAKVEAKLAAALLGNMGSLQRSLGDQIDSMAPKSTSCREEGSAELQRACESRDFLRRHEAQQEHPEDPKGWGITIDRAGDN